MPAIFIVDLVSTWSGSILFLAFVVISICLSGLALNWLLGLRTPGIEGIAYAAAGGCVVYALVGIAVSLSGSGRHWVAVSLLILVWGVSAVVLFRQRLLSTLYTQLDSGDRISLGMFFVFLCLCSGISYLSIQFPASMPDGPYLFKTHDVHVKIQAMTHMPCDNYIPHAVSEFLLRGISFKTEHPIIPGQEVADRPILMALIVVPFRSAFDQPALQNGPLPRFQYVGQSWPDTSAFEDDGIFRQFLTVAIVLNGFIFLSAIVVFKRLGNTTIQLTGCLLMLLSPYFLTETLFTWPKCLAAFFLILAIYSLETLKYRTFLVTGVLVGLGYLSHPFGIVFAGSLGLYLLLQVRGKKATFRDVLQYCAGFAATTAPWFIWTKLVLHLSSDLIEQNVGANVKLADLVWVRFHNAYETLGGRMFELPAFDPDQLVDLAIFCLPGIVGLLFVAHAYREVVESVKTRSLVSVFSILIPGALVIGIFGFPSVVPVLNGLQVSAVLLILWALLRMTRQGGRRWTLYGLVAAQLIFNGSLLYIRASSLGVFDLIAQGEQNKHSDAILASASDVVPLIGWPSITIRKTKNPPNLNVPITIGDTVKKSMFLTPPDEIVFTGVPLGANPMLIASIGIHPAVWKDLNGDGAVFEVDVTDGNKSAVVFKKLLNPAHVLFEQRWNNLIADLAQFKNERVTITIKALPGPAENDYADWCIWGEPRIIEAAGH